MTIVRTVLLLSAAFVAVACAGPGSKPTDANRKEAAATQVQLARGYLEKGRTELALDKINRALQIDPNSVDALTVAAVINESIGRIDDAERYFSQAVEIEPENGDLLNNYGTLLHQLGRYQEAITYFEKALAQPFYRTPAAALSNAGASAEKQDRQPLAEEYYRRALEREPNYPDALFRLARIMLAKEQPLRARAFLQRLEARTQPLPEMLLLGYRIECAMGDDKSATEYANNLRSRYPDSEQAREMTESTSGELCTSTATTKSS